MSLAAVFALAVVLILFIFAWYGLSYVLSAGMNDADGLAKITGNCGDTMEIGLKLQEGRVARTHFWTNGCAMSRTCVESAARLAYGHNLAELSRLTMIDIINDVGHIPDTHLHCAQLAETTLHRAAAACKAAAEVPPPPA